MRSLIGCMLVLAASPHVHAQGDLGPAARAKAIAPFVEEETALVVHVDLSRMASQPTFGLLSQVLSFAPVDMYSDKVAAIFDAGVKDLYLVAPPTALISERPKMYFVAPVSSGEQEKALRTALRLRSDEGQTVHGALVVAWPRLKQFRPVERPELAAAFEAAGDTAAQVILIPPADTRRVIDELMPQLPKELGGGPSSVLTARRTLGSAGHRRYTSIVAAGDPIGIPWRGRDASCQTGRASESRRATAGHLSEAAAVRRNRQLALAASRR